MSAFVRDLLRKPYSMHVLLSCIFILCHIPLMQYLVYPDPNFIVCCDVNRYLTLYVRKMKAGLTPYRDFECEYPPLALLLFLLPAMTTNELDTYQYQFVLEQLAFEVIGLLIIGALLRRMRVQREETMFVLLGYMFLLASVGPTLYSRYDITVSALILATIFLFLIGKQKSAWAFLAISFMTKPYAIVIAPLFLITQFHEKETPIPAILKGILVFSSTLLVIALPFLILSAQGLIHSFVYHAERGIQLETLYSAIVHMFYAFGIITEAEIEFRYGAFELISPVSPFLSTLAFFLTAIVLLSTYLAFYKMKLWQQAELSLETKSWYLYRASVVAILGFIIFYKVFSSQFLIWAYPLIPLVLRKPELREKSITGVLMIIGAATLLIYPFNYVIADGRLWINTVFVLIVRNLLLLFCLVLIAAWDQIANRLPRFSPLIIILLGIFLIEIYPLKYLAQGFPSRFNILLFLLAMGLFQLWDILKTGIVKKSQLIEPSHTIQQGFSRKP